MPEPAEFLVTLESRLAQRLLDFDLLDEDEQLSDLLGQAVAASGPIR